MPQSFANPGGTGNRTASITTTTTATAGAGNVTQLVNGTRANEFWWSSGQSGREVKFDFGAARLITEANWYQDSASAHGTWQWQGSPDNSAWTNIGATFTLGSSVGQTIATLSGNVTSYRYYRMLQTAGTTSSSPYLREVEFLIDGTADAVALLVHCDGTNGSTSFTDTRGGHTLTATSATVSTASPKFGTGCASLTTASTANINTGNAVDFNLGAGLFTVEAWGYIPSGVSGVQAIISQWGWSQRGWLFGFNGNTLNFFYSTTGSDNPAFTGSYTPPTNQWIHFAADRDASNNFRLYANGVVIATGNTSSTIFASTANCIIGNDLEFGNRAFPGFLDEVRVTKGRALYAGAFTPPTGPFPDPQPAVTQPTRVWVMA